MQSSGEGRTLHGATCAQVCECATRTEREWTRGTSGTSGTGDLSFHLLRTRLLLRDEAAPSWGSTSPSSSLLLRKKAEFL